MTSAWWVSVRFPDGTEWALPFARYHDAHDAALRWSATQAVGVEISVLEFLPSVSLSARRARESHR